MISNFPRWKEHGSVSPTTSLCIVYHVSLQPVPKTQHRPSCVCSQTGSTSSLCHSFLPARVNPSGKWWGGRARSWDWHSVSPAALGLSSQPGHPASPEHHLPNVLLSRAPASGLKSWKEHPIHGSWSPSQLAYRILALKAGWASGQEASLACPCFSLGKGIGGLGWPEVALGSRMALGSTGAPCTQEGANSINWICQGLGAALTSLRSLAQALSAQKDLCVLLCKSSQASWEGKG